MKVDGCWVQSIASHLSGEIGFVSRPGLSTVWHPAAAMAVCLCWPAVLSTPAYLNYQPVTSVDCIVCVPQGWSVAKLVAAQVEAVVAADVLRPCMVNPRRKWLGRRCRRR
jgi:hypothetical protein